MHVFKRVNVCQSLKNHLVYWGHIPFGMLALRFNRALEHKKLGYYLTVYKQVY